MQKYASDASDKHPKHGGYKEKALMSKDVKAFCGDERNRTADSWNAIGFGSDFMQFDE